MQFYAKHFVESVYFFANINKMDEKIYIFLNYYKDMGGDIIWRKNP